jgi:hypothetical protein
MLCAGVVWVVVGSLLPTVLVRQQGLAYRLFYFPLAGLGVALGALVWLASRWLSSVLVQKALLAAAGGALLFTVLCTVGYSRLFLARYELDRKEIDAVMRALPASALPANSSIVIFDPDQPDFGGPFAGRKDMHFLTSVFGAPWSADAVFHLWYCRKDLQVLLGTRGPGVAFARPGDGQLKVRDVTVPLAKTVLVVYRNGNAAVVKQLINLRGNSHEWVIDFPLAQELVRQGSPGLDVVVVLNGYWDNRMPPVLPDFREFSPAGSTGTRNAASPGACNLDL